MLVDVAVGRVRTAPETETVTERADLASFAEIFETQRPRALRLAYAMAGDAEIAEDAVAEAFARTYRQWLKGAVRDPEQYVRRAVVNEIRSFWRRRAVRRRYDERARTGELTTAASADRLADADVLQRALMVLPPRVRAVVWLRVVEDMSEQQTADALGISLGSVKAYLSRGLERLRASLATEGDAS
jgi:RNA polymerase sigma-70 factor (sigma-E family)